METRDKARETEKRTKKMQRYDKKARENASDKSKGNQRIKAW